MLIDFKMCSKGYAGACKSLFSAITYMWGLIFL